MFIQRRGITETTFKPLLDRSIATDGAWLVLKASRHSAVVLRSDGDGWVVIEHPRASGGPARGAADAAKLETWHWRGRDYHAEGSRLAQFGALDPERMWNDFYDLLLAVRAGNCGPVGFVAAV